MLQAMQWPLLSLRPQPDEFEGVAELLAVGGLSPLLGALQVALQPAGLSYLVTPLLMARASVRSHTVHTVNGAPTQVFSRALGIVFSQPYLPPHQKSVQQFQGAVLDLAMASDGLASLTVASPADADAAAKARIKALAWVLMAYADLNNR